MARIWLAPGAMKNLLCIVVILACIHYFKRPAVGITGLKQWEQERAQAEAQLQGETLSYQEYMQMPGSCPKLPAVRQQQLAQVGIARENAIRVLERKPSALTIAEEGRLKLYKQASSRAAQGLPACDPSVESSGVLALSY